MSPSCAHVPPMLRRVSPWILRHVVWHNRRPSAPPKHQFVVQKEGPKSTFHMGTGALFPTSDLSATRPNNLEASRPPITSLRDQLELIVGVSPMRSFIRLVRSTMESSRSTRSRDRALSDTGVDPIKRPVEGRVEGSPVRILGLIILCPQSSL